MATKTTSLVSRSGLSSSLGRGFSTRPVNRSTTGSQGLAPGIASRASYSSSNSSYSSSSPSYQNFNSRRAALPRANRQSRAVAVLQSGMNVRSFTSSNGMPSVPESGLLATTRGRRLNSQMNRLAGLSNWRGGIGARRSLFIRTEATPNENALKFTPNCRVLPEGFPAPFIEYLTPRSTVSPPYPSPLAASLLAVDGVDSVFFGTDYITVIKDGATAWQHVKPEVFSLITEYATAGKAMVTPSAKGHDGATSGAAGAAAAGAAGGSGADAHEHTDSLAYNEADDEVVGMIKELLETRIRPTIQEDGGDIDFRGFENGIVYLRLRGACRTCDSSTLTLKRGIESMLMHYIEEVEGVEQVLDPEEEVAMKEFAKFEERLKRQSGGGYQASTA